MKCSRVDSRSNPPAVKKMARMFGHMADCYANLSYSLKGWRMIVILCIAIAIFVLYAVGKMVESGKLSHPDKLNADARRVQYEQASNTLNSKQVAFQSLPTIFSFLASNAEFNEKYTDYAREVLDELEAELGSTVDLSFSTMGDAYLKSAEFMTPRLEAGLTEHDVLRYWNRPLLLVYFEQRMLSDFVLIYLNFVEQAGGDLILEGEKYKINNPRFGDPSRFNKNSLYYRNLTESDAELYYEFFERVSAWKAKVSAEHVNELIVKYGSFNAAVRSQIVEKKV